MLPNRPILRRRLRSGGWAARTGAAPVLRVAGSKRSSGCVGFFVTSVRYHMRLQESNATGMRPNAVGAYTGLVCDLEKGRGERERGGRLTVCCDTVNQGRLQSGPFSRACPPTQVARERSRRIHLRGLVVGIEDRSCVHFSLWGEGTRVPTNPVLY